MGRRRRVRRQAPAWLGDLTSAEAECVTCIAGVAEAGKVWIGGDSRCTEGTRAYQIVEPKVFRKGEMIFGCCGAARYGEIMKYAFDLPEHPKGMSVEKYLHTLFVAEVRGILAEQGFMKSENEVVEVSNGSAIFGYRGHLWWLDDDLGIGRAHDNFNAIGTGDAYALGALSVLPKTMRPAHRVRTALEVAARHDMACGAPFKVLSL